MGIPPHSFSTVKTAVGDSPLSFWTVKNGMGDPPLSFWTVKNGSENLPATAKTVLPVIFFSPRSFLTVRKNNGRPQAPRSGQKANKTQGSSRRGSGPEGRPCNLVYRGAVLANSRNFELATNRPIKPSEKTFPSVARISFFISARRTPNPRPAMQAIT